MNIGKRIKLLRKKQGLSQKKMGEDLGLGISTISQYENLVNTPDTKTVIKIAEYFNVTTDYLFGLTDRPDFRLLKKEELEEFLPKKTVEEEEIHLQVDGKLKKLDKEKQEQIKKYLKEIGVLD